MKTQKKVLQNWNTFCPNSGEDQKKRFSPKMELFFPPKFKWTSKLRRTPASNDWGDADVDHTQTNGGDTVKLFEEIYPPHPPPPCFGTPGTSKNHFALATLVAYQHEFYRKKSEGAVFCYK